METKMKPLSGARLGIAILTLATALVHLILSFNLGFDVMFFLNFLGYIALLVAYLFPVPIIKDYRPLVRWGFIGFTLLSIVAWLILGDKTWYVGIIDKLIEVGLVVLLWREKP